MDENKKKSLELAIKQIDKQFGKGTISNIDKAGKHLKVSFAEGGEKAFIYPDAFVQGFLTLDKGE